MRRPEPVERSVPSVEQVRAALARVDDPEIRRPITELGMVRDVVVDPAGHVHVAVLLTVVGCPMRDRLTNDVTEAVRALAGVTGVTVEFGVMDEGQRSALQATLRAGQPAAKEIPFAQPGSLTKVFAVASGKGGVGKSSTTVNLAVAMAGSGLTVGVVDADIYGHSLPDMLGVAGVLPTVVGDMRLPVATPFGPSLLSMGMFKPRREQAVMWRGPMLDRALVQMLTDFYWGDLDVLLLDLPPGTGDIPMSLGQHLPSAEVVVVTTPQQAAAEVAERAGTMAAAMRQRVVGVVENMSYLPCPHCTPSGVEHRIDLFGSGGGSRVARTLTDRLGYDVPLLGEVPLDSRLREGGDAGRPIVVADPDAPASAELRRVAERLAGRSRNLAGRQLGLTPVGKL